MFAFLSHFLKIYNHRKRLERFENSKKTVTNNQAFIQQKSTFPCLQYRKRTTRIRITGRRNIPGSYTLKRKITCFVGTASGSGKRFASKFAKTTFTSEGFSNWKKALEKLATHETSDMHKEAVSAHAIFIGQRQGIDAVLFSKKQQQKVVGREAMKVIFDTSKTMARQAIAFRGHTEVDSNFYQIIRLVARSGNHCMQSWLEKKYDWTSPESQNGILKVLYRGVMAVLLDSIKCSPGGLFAVMVDDTTDISNVEQMSLCLRYVKDDLTVSEIFLGFIETPSTTGENMYKQLCDSLNALGLSLDQCRGQGYDGSSNMIGCLKGLATRVSNDFPLAVFSYCNGHMLNLIVQDACKEPHTVKALDLLRAVVNFIKDSPKREASFASFSRLEEHSGSVGLRPLCSTRWVCRVPALKSFVHNYERLMKWFAELTTAGSVSDKRVALGYLNSLRKFKNYFSILLLQKIFTTVHWTYLAIHKPNLSITKCTDKIGNLLAILKAECTAEAGASLYHSCVQESRPVENGGIGILQPGVPRGWRSCSVDNVREFQPQFQPNPPLNVLKIEEYFVGLYVSTFESIIESIEGRYKISPIALSIEKYLAATNETELEECGESISTIAAHVGSNTLQLKMEMKQFRRYEIETKIPPATCVDEIGITLSFNTALRTILQTLSNVVQLVLLVPATTCTQWRSQGGASRGQAPVSAAEAPVVAPIVGPTTSLVPQVCPG